MKKIYSVAIRGRPVTTVQQYNSTTVQQYNSTTVQQYNSTTVQQYNSTTVQRIELGSDRYANCITTVSKDSMVLIKEENGR